MATRNVFTFALQAVLQHCLAALSCTLEQLDQVLYELVAKL